MSLIFSYLVPSCPHIPEADASTSECEAVLTTTNILPHVSSWQDLGLITSSLWTAVISLQWPSIGLMDGQLKESSGRDSIWNESLPCTMEACPAVI